jgi:two-component system cell cycle sensor histidine kinase/response regulator CckA
MPPVVRRANHRKKRWPIKEQHEGTAGMGYGFDLIVEDGKGAGFGFLGRAVQESEEDFRRAFLRFPLPAAIIARDDERFVEINKAFEELLGYTRREAIGRTSAELGIWEDPTTRERFIAKMTGTGEARDVEIRIRHKDQRIVAGLLSGVALTFEGKECLQSVFTNIAERIRGEEALRASEGRFRSLTEGMPQAVYETDDDGRITYLNPYGMVFFGFSQEEFNEGISLLDLIAAEDREKARDTFRKRIRGGLKDPMEYLWVRKDGSKFTAIVHAAPICQPGKRTGTCGVLTDLSLLKKAQAELACAQKYKEVGRLAGGIAHHLNNLMTIVSGYGSYILAQMEQHDPWRREIGNMVHAGKRAAALTAQLLSYSRKQLLRPERTHPERFLSGIEDELRGRGGSDVKVTFLHDPGEWEIVVDRDLLRNALFSMVENSVRAMPNGGEITVRSGRPEIGRNGESRVPSGEYATISVTDTGVGMNLKTLSHVFEPFFTTRQPGEGVGMSLPAVYGFVKQSNGYVFVESEPGNGTTVSMHFPLANS